MTFSHFLDVSKDVQEVRMPLGLRLTHFKQHRPSGPRSEKSNHNYVHVYLCAGTRSADTCISQGVEEPWLLGTRSKSEQEAPAGGHNVTDVCL